MQYAMFPNVKTRNMQYFLKLQYAMFPKVTKRVTYNRHWSEHVTAQTHVVFRR